MDTQELAKTIVKTFAKEGYTAFYAGGWVRDYLLGNPSSDIDIATSAPPEKITELFPKTVPVGISFGVVIVVMEGHPFEISTFRKDLDYVDGRHPEGIELSSPEEDAKRRDFTINGMFYDPLEDKIIDFVNGQEDLKKGIIRAIGNPEERFEEDRLRMIRALRFVAKFGYTLEPKTREAISHHANQLFPSVAIERIWQELKKMTDAPQFDEALIEMHQLGLLEVIFPDLKEVNIKDRVVHIKKHPKNCPAILAIMELFPDDSLEKLLEICEYLKVSNQEKKLVELTYRIQKLPAEASDAEWTRIYAQPDAEICLDAACARWNPVKVHEYTARRQRLKSHIERIRIGSPLVTSAHLMLEGIRPGKLMGDLLQEAETLAINHHLHTHQEVMTLLKQTTLWPKS